MKTKIPAVCDLISLELANFSFVDNTCFDRFLSQLERKRSPGDYNFVGGYSFGKPGLVDTIMAIMDLESSACGRISLRLNEITYYATSLLVMSSSFDD